LGPGCVGAGIVVRVAQAGVGYWGADAASDVYPIASFSWVLLRRAQPDITRARALVYMWRWMITDGQRFATDLLYAALPTDARNFGLVQLTKIASGDKPVIPYLAAG
jgi:ABC-type phosphate transport system substrate-binding protein